MNSRMSYIIEGRVYSATSYNQALMAHRIWQRRCSGYPRAESFAAVKRRVGA